MCGLAGILIDRTRARVQTEDVLRMAAVLRHRGPDGYGAYVDDHVGLAHTRLSILDLEGGAQPMSADDRRIWVVFNGEIFNHIELRQALEAVGHRFHTRSDTEVIIHAYQQWADRAWERFNGQFAIGLWDSRERKLWLVRDRVGMLPLFWSQVGGRVVFGSEPKALFASGYVSPQPDARGLALAFMLWSSPAPATIFSNINSVEPGEAICFDDRLWPQRTRYWQMNFGAARRSNTSIAEATAELDQRLTHAVKIRLRADVPVGAYLSGGLDSSVIASLARQIDSAPLQTFALRFDDKAFDETGAQRRMAAILGTKHHEIVVGPRDINRALPEVIWHAETPLLRTGPAPMFLLSQLVRDSGMKVVLTGEGADEFLAGYDVFKEAAIRRFWARQPASQWRPALLARLHRYVGGERSNPMWQAFFRNGLTETSDPFYSHRVRWSNSAWTIRFLSDEVRNAAEVPIDANVARALPTEWTNWPPLERAQAIEIATFMSSYLLSSQGDRVAMAHGVEVRYPYLDPDVVDLCQSLPHGCKLRGLRDKIALRALASKRLPEDVWRRPKWPYRAPIAAALLGPDAPEYVQALLSPGEIARYGLLDPQPVHRLIQQVRDRAGRFSEREEMALIGVLSLQMLASQYVDGFAERLRDLRRELDNHRPNVLEDHRSGVPRGPMHMTQPAR